MTIHTLCVYLFMAEYLEGLDEGPQQDSDGLSLPEQLDETSCSEQPQEAQVDEVILRNRGRKQSASPNTRHLHSLPLPNTKAKNNSGRKRVQRERERERRGGEGEKHNLLQTKWLLVDTSTNEGKTEKKSKDKEKMKEGGKREEIKEIIIQRV